MKKQYTNEIHHFSKALIIVSGILVFVGGCLFGKTTSAHAADNYKNWDNYNSGSLSIQDGINEINIDTAAIKGYIDYSDDAIESRLYKSKEDATNIGDIYIDNGKYYYVTQNTPTIQAIELTTINDAIEKRVDTAIDDAVSSIDIFESFQSNKAYNIGAQVIDDKKIYVCIKDVASSNTKKPANDLYDAQTGTGSWITLNQVPISKWSEDGNTLTITY